MPARCLKPFHCISDKNKNFSAGGLALAPLTHRLQPPVFTLPAVLPFFLILEQANLGLASGPLPLLFFEAQEPFSQTLVSLAPL